jgi:D-alanyl-D-alanine-carboxypeptidase/D-alanyl-D-alanine-endopeptidase
MRKQILLFFVSLLFVTNLWAQNRANLQKQIDKIIYYDTEINLSETPGFIIGVKYQDSIFYFSYGSISKDFEQKPNKTTIFEIGGLTKTFTSSLVSILVSEGKMDFKKSLNDYLPATEKNKETQQITIDQLLTHTSHLPRMPLEFGVKETENNNPYAHYTKQDLMDFYKNYIPLQPKKGKKQRKRRKQDHDDYSYSHLNYALVEVAIETSQGTSFEKLLTNKLLIPISLTDTRMELSENQKKRLATGYTISGRSTVPWTFQSFEASEGLKSTAKDLVKFAEMNIGISNSKLTNALYNTHEGRKKTSRNKKVKSARGWHVISPKNYYDILLHMGNTNGHRSYLAFVKESETAVIILTNSEHNLYNLGYYILRMLNNNWTK